MEEIKYVVIDTTSWRYCCLASESGEDKKVLTSVYEKLEAGELILILPETVVIEFNRTTDEDLSNFKKEFDNASKEFSLLSSYPSHHAKKKTISDIKKEVESNYQEARKQILKISNHKNTIQTTITPELMTAALKRGMSGLKPYNFKIHQENHISGAFIQSDCLLIEEVKSYLKDKKNYHLFICTNNTRDFADKDNNEKIHHSDVILITAADDHWSGLSQLFHTFMSCTKLERSGSLDSNQIASKIVTYEDFSFSSLVAGELARRRNPIFESLLITFEKLKKLGLIYYNGKVVFLTQTNGTSINED